MNYVQKAEELLKERMPAIDSALLPLYTLLVFTQGENVTREHVHDAWACWRNQTNPDHKSLIPFDQLTPEIQDLDQRYTDFIAEVAQLIY